MQLKRSLCLFLFMGCWGAQSAGLVCERIWTVRCVLDSLVSISMIGVMKLQLKRSLCLFLFMGCWGAQSAGLVCERIWTVRCDDCQAPMLMKCAGKIRGHIKNSSVIKTLRMLFYVTGEDGAEIQTVEINGFQLYPSFDEYSHGTLWRDKMERAWPDVSIVGFKIQYILDQDVRFYGDPDGQHIQDTYNFETGIQDKDRAVEMAPVEDSDFVPGTAESVVVKNPALDPVKDSDSASEATRRVVVRHSDVEPVKSSNSMTKKSSDSASETTESIVKDSGSVLGDSVDQTPLSRLPENSAAMELKKEQPLMKQEKAKTEEEKIEREREYIEKHWTGNEESRCWFKSDFAPVYVGFIEDGDSRRICVMKAICLNAYNDAGNLTRQWLFCRFDSEANSCPTATQCLRDTDVKAGFDTRLHRSIYGVNDGLLPLAPLGDRESVANESAVSPSE